MTSERQDHVVFARQKREDSHTFLILELDNDTDWTEDFLLDNLHIRCGIRENCWVDVESFCANTITTQVNSSALIFSGLNVFHDALNIYNYDFMRSMYACNGTHIILKLGDLRTLVRVEIEWVSNL